MSNHYAGAEGAMALLVHRRGELTYQKMAEGGNDRRQYHRQPHLSAGKAPRLEDTSPIDMAESPDVVL